MGCLVGFKKLISQVFNVGGVFVEFDFIEVLAVAIPLIVGYVFRRLLLRFTPKKDEGWSLSKIFVNTLSLAVLLVIFLLLYFILSGRGLWEGEIL
jgi:hypothetical protein